MSEPVESNWHHLPTGAWCTPGTYPVLRESSALREAPRSLPPLFYKRCHFDLSFMHLFMWVLFHPGKHPPCLSAMAFLNLYVTCLGESVPLDTVLSYKALCLFALFCCEFFEKGSCKYLRNSRRAEVWLTQSLNFKYRFPGGANNIWWVPPLCSCPRMSQDFFVASLGQKKHLTVPGLPYNLAAAGKISCVYIGRKNDTCISFLNNHLYLRQVYP